MINPTIIIHSDDVIQHFGTKGMKWGVRKAQVIVSRQRGIPRQNIKTPTKLTSEVKSKVLLKKMKEVSDFRSAYGGDVPPKRDYVMKKDLAEFDRLSKIYNSPRPKNGSKKLKAWGDAYERAAKLTEKGADDFDNRMVKAYEKLTGRNAIKDYNSSRKEL